MLALGVGDAVAVKVVPGVWLIVLPGWEPVRFPAAEDVPCWGVGVGDGVGVGHSHSANALALSGLFARSLSDGQGVGGQILKSMTARTMAKITWTMPSIHARRLSSGVDL